MNATIDVTNMCIETERLFLRSWQQNDLESFYINAFEDEDELEDSVEKPPIEIFRRILDNIIEERKTFALVLKRLGR